MKILIAENNSAARMHHREQLISWGYDFDLATNGKEAVDFFHKNRASYDLCLMNVNLPAMEGIKAIRAIRQGAGYLPVIACSTNSNYKACCLEAGADDFLVKPFVAEGLKDKLEAFSVKQVVLYLERERLSLHTVGPVSRAELNELRALDKKGLTKFMIADVSCHFVAHQGARHKLFDDFNNGDSVFTEILDRTRYGHSIVQIHASQISVRKVGLTPEHFQQLVEKENEMLKKYEVP